MAKKDPPKTPPSTRPGAGGISSRKFACSTCGQRFTASAARDVHQATCKGY